MTDHLHEMHQTIGAILQSVPNSAEYRKLLEALTTCIADDGAAPHTENDVAEARRVALVTIIVFAPQESALQKAAFRELLTFIVSTLDRHSRRSYLPPDESAQIAINALARVRDKNFENLKKFLAKRSENPDRLLRNWLRIPCKGAISARLRALTRTGLLATDDAGLTAMDQKERSTTLVLQKLINAHDAESRRIMFASADAKLDAHQRRALAFYASMWCGTLPDECDAQDRVSWEEEARTLGTHERVRAAYARIAKELGLADAKAAEKVVKAAKQRARNAIRKLSDHEESNEHDHEESNEHEGE